MLKHMCLFIYFNVFKYCMYTVFVMAGEDVLQVVRLQTDILTTTTSYLDAGYGALPTLNQVSEIDK